MDLTGIAAARVANQKLGSQKCETPQDAVSWLGAVQAQDFAAAKWSLGLRVETATDAAVESAFNEGLILRTHVMRPTWHFVRPEDIHSLLALTAQRVSASNRPMLRRLELDRDLLALCLAILEEALGDHNYQTRAELAAKLAERGIHAAGQRLAYIMMHAELEALVCSGPRRGKQFTYALLDERAPRAEGFSRDEALRQWAIRYFNSHGPAQDRDFAWWCGLTMRDARLAIQLAGQELATGTSNGFPYWFSPDPAPQGVNSPRAWLLSIYDEYAIAYRDRSAIAEERIIEKLLSMGNAATSIILIDGRIAGTWKRSINKQRVDITLQLFRSLDRKEQPAIEEAAAQYGAFLETPASISRIDQWNGASIVANGPLSG